MKKIVSLLLVAILVVSIATFSAFANDRIEELGDEISFCQQKLFELYPATKNAYDEGMLHYEEIGMLDVDSDDAFDFLLISTALPIVSDALDSMVLGDRYIAQNCIYYPFRFTYAFFDIEKTEFVPLTENILGEYPLMDYYFDEYKIGVPFGDADNNGKLSVLDATYIQRVVAKLDDFCEGENLGYYNLPTDFRSDINFDNEVDILDATCIQLILAKKPINTI